MPLTLPSISTSAARETDRPGLSPAHRQPRHRRPAAPAGRGWKLRACQRARPLPMCPADPRSGHPIPRHDGDHMVELGRRRHVVRDGTFGVDENGVRLHPDWRKQRGEQGMFVLAITVLVLEDVARPMRRVALGGVQGAPPSNLGAKGGLEPPGVATASPSSRTAYTRRPLIPRPVFALFLYGGGVHTVSWSGVRNRNREPLSEWKGT